MASSVFLEASHGRTRCRESAVNVCRVVATRRSTKGTGDRSPGDDLIISPSSLSSPKPVCVPDCDGRGSGTWKRGGEGGGRGGTYRSTGNHIAQGDDDNHPLRNKAPIQLDQDPVGPKPPARHLLMTAIFIPRTTGQEQIAEGNGQLRPESRETIFALCSRSFRVRLHCCGLR